MQLSDGRVINLDAVVWVSEKRTLLTLITGAILTVTMEEGEAISRTLLRWGLL